MLKKITIEDFARMTQNGFASVHTEISELREEVRSCFTEMRRGFADLKGSIRVLAGEIIEVKTAVEDHE